MTEVIGHSSHVTIYALDVSTKSWVSLCSQADSEWQPSTLTFGFWELPK